jgi:hypothetical protein
MKTSILILALASLPWLSMAQDAQSPAPASAEVKNFKATILDLEWGSSEADVKALMAKQKDVTALREDPNQQVYVGGEYLGLPVETWQLRFLGDKLYEVRVRFEYRTGNTNGAPAADAMVDGLTKSLTDKIGEDAAVVKTDEHTSYKWSFSKSDPPTKESEAIALYHNWIAGMVKVTYTNLYYQRLTPEAAAVDGNEL